MRLLATPSTPRACPEADAADKANRRALEELSDAIASHGACQCEADQQHLRSTGAILGDIAGKTQKRA
jgi:hypothetical protein